ncbi:MAG: PRD domain-containing protein [Ethanoligenens sp.]|uniref:PRD domain-containing protein n=1 Tax=Ethanoligenens sp. TaxID=2099655 RepID=UPI0039ED8E89
MEYRVVTAMNNNVVLACDEKTKEQIILMSKGIGFGRKAGDIVSDDGTNRQIFKLWAGDKDIKPIQADRAAVEELVNDLVSLAKEQLGVENPKLYDALLDHIQFAIDRLRFGLPIENPFIHEIAVLYTREYEVASAVVQMIQSRLHVNVGEAEIGFIALHLHSAGKNGPFDQSMRSVQLYKEVMQLLEHSGVGTPSSRSVFLQTLFDMLDMIRRGTHLKFPFPKAYTQTLSESAGLAQQICACVEKSCRLSFDDEAVCFMILDLEKLRQATLS